MNTSVQLSVDYLALCMIDFNKWKLHTPIHGLLNKDNNMQEQKSL